MKAELIKNAVPPVRKGSNTKYNFERLDAGDALVFTCDNKEHIKIQNSAHKYAKRHRLKITVVRDEDKTIVYRLTVL